MPGAAETFEEVLSDFLRVLGHDHPETLETRHSLARWRGESGDPAAAAVDLTELLSDYERVFGATHPRTLAIHTSLARWRSRATES
ncbi:tetratricopeptide repeat protein [Saccharopolyspora sp. ID03-671]